MLAGSEAVQNGLGSWIAKGVSAATTAVDQATRAGFKPGGYTTEDWLKGLHDGAMDGGGAINDEIVKAKATADVAIASATEVTSSEGQDAIAKALTGGDGLLGETKKQSAHQANMERYLRRLADTGVVLTEGSSI